MICENIDTHPGLVPSKMRRCYIRKKVNKKRSFIPIGYYCEKCHKIIKDLVKITEYKAHGERKSLIKTDYRNYVKDGSQLAQERKYPNNPNLYNIKWCHNYKEHNHGFYNKTKIVYTQHFKCEDNRKKSKFVSIGYFCEECQNIYSILDVRLYTTGGAELTDDKILQETKRMKKLIAENKIPNKSDEKYEFFKNYDNYLEYFKYIILKKIQKLLERENF